ncbi:MAG: helix-turn-helix transcriptional regulator [Clostridia bacterium]|nr:helix-turn-helix transcriptional regulator [Clostridia bacterium]
MANDFFAKKNIVKQRPVLEYAVNNGADKSLHAHPHPEFIFVVGGSGRFETKDNQYPIKAGDIIVCSKEVLHSEYLFDSPDSEMYHVGLSGTILGNMEQDELINEPFCIAHSGKMYDILKAYFSALISETLNPQLNSKMVEEDLLRVLLITVLRLAVCDMGLAYSQNRAFFEAKDYFDKNYLYIDNIDKACKILNINKFYLTHIFKEQLGMPPIKYLLSKRMEKAKHLLGSTTLSIRDVSLKCGYSDTAYFCRVFKKSENITPLQYRIHVKNNNLV